MSTPARVLVVDDDPDIRRLLGLRLASAGHEVIEAESGEAALAAFDARRPQLVITDLRMDGMDGMALFDALRQRAPTLPVIMLTAHGTIPEAVEATRRGAFGFVTKPFDGRQLLEQVTQALALSASPVPAPDDPWREGFITRSPRMEELLSRAQRVAVSDASVLIRGASGTGKEMLARVLHRASPRAAAPFVAVNCAAIPENLLESELFGHRKGAFTGASYDHRGLIPEAEGGTLFLDEIGDMPIALQAKLLRVLQEREVRPVGAARSLPVNIRLVSATHRDLEGAVRAGGFREDLFYRINVIGLELPSLAERREDILPLAMHFLKRFAERDRRPVEAFAPEAQSLLVAAAWPGNIRQLMNVVEQAVTLAGGALIPADLVQEALRESPQPLASLEEARRGFEREYLVRALRLAEGNVSRAARLAQRNRTEFYKLLERHALDPALFKPGA